jgi:transcriptional antiterminator RfaH
MAVKWYVARTEPRSEHLAEDRLERDGFQVFLPRIRSTNVKSSDKFVPIFPGYLFLKLDREMSPIKPSHRLMGWVSFEGETPWIPDETMDELMLKVNEINGQAGLWRRFKVGDKVEIVSGSIQGLGEVIKDGKSSGSRVQVLLQFMGRLLQAQIPRKYVWPVQEQPVEIQRPRRTRGRGRWIKEDPHSVSLVRST